MSYIPFAKERCATTPCVNILGRTRHPNMATIPVRKIIEIRRPAAVKTKMGTIYQ